jgi:hypothetical protein
LKYLIMLLVSVIVIALTVVQRLENGTAGAHPVFVFGSIISVFIIADAFFSFYFNKSRKKG